MRIKIGYCILSLLKKSCLSGVIAFCHNLKYPNSFSGVNFYLKYGDDLVEVFNALNPLEAVCFLQLIVSSFSAIISGFGFLSILMKLKSSTQMQLAALFYYLFSVIYITSSTKIEFEIIMEFI